MSRTFSSTAPQVLSLSKEKIVPLWEQLHGLIDPHPILANAQRQTCSRCNKKVKYFCYNCIRPLPDLKIPRVSLNPPLTILHHLKEKSSKSTAIHAGILAPESTRFIPFHHQAKTLFPEENLSEMLLLIPTPEAQSPEHYVKDFDKISQIVVIDGTWHQAKVMVQHPDFKEMKHCAITKHQTSFWRHQNFGPTGLATIEAIYYFYREISELLHPDTGADPNLDNLLFFYKFFHDTIIEAASTKERPFDPNGYFINKDQEDSRF